MGLLSPSSHAARRCCWEVVRRVRVDEKREWIPPAAEKVHHDPHQKECEDGGRP